MAKIDAGYMVYPHRDRKKFHLHNPRAQAQIAIELAKNGDLVQALDCVEQLVDEYPQNNLSYLDLARQIYDAMHAVNRYDLYQKREFNFPIREGDKVLDIGSGPMPFPLATHLADIAEKDDSYGRGGAPLKMLAGRPFTECPVEKTPFADKEFDFVYASHVLEHSTDPGAACEELMRIGKKGYIETPTAGKDCFMNFAKISNHLWDIKLVNDTLYFIEYSKLEREGIACDVMRDMADNPTTTRERAFSAIMNLKARNFNTMLMWGNGFKYKIIRTGGSEAMSDLSSGQILAAAVASSCPC